MPIARLISRELDGTHELAGHLRARGFTVEIVSPEAIPDHHADLEIKVEEYSTEEALRLGEELSQAEDLHVFIAPGSIVEHALPAAEGDPQAETTTIVEEVLPTEEVIAQQEQPDTAITSQALIAAETMVEEPVLGYVSKDEVSVHEDAKLSFETQEEAEVEAQPIDVVIASGNSGLEPVAKEPMPEQAAFAIESAGVFPPSDWPLWQPLAEEGSESEDAKVPIEVQAQAETPRTLSFPRVFAFHSNERTFWQIAALASVVAFGV